MSFDNTRIAAATENGVDMGMGVFATKTLYKGSDIITVETPFVAVVEEKQLHRICSACFDTPQPSKTDQMGAGMVKACTKCKVVAYCNKECQLKDWRLGHSLECPIFTALHPRILPSNVRAVLRILLRKRANKIPKEDYEHFLKLTFPSSEDARDRLDMYLLSQAVKEYGSFQELDEEFLGSVFGRLDLNSFNLTSAFNTFRGIYLHPYTARFNHSCDANATYSFDGGKCYVKAIRTIGKDEQIFVPYSDSTFSVATRRKELRDRFKFLCQCKRCLDDCKNMTQANIHTRASIEQETNSALEEIWRHSSRKRETRERDEDQKKEGEEIEKCLMILLKKVTSQLDPSAVHRQEQPLSSIRADLMSAQVSANKYYDLVINAAIQHLRSDPVLYPDENHPLRRDHAIAFFQYVVYAMEDLREIDRSHPLFREGLELSVILESLGNWLLCGSYDTSREGGDSIIWPNPTLEKEARRAAQMAHLSRLKFGISDQRLGDYIKDAWSKLERIVDDTLRWEMAA